MAEYGEFRINFFFQAQLIDFEIAVWKILFCNDVLRILQYIKFVSKWKNLSVIISSVNYAQPVKK